VTAATNRDLREAVGTHMFCEDLYYRLNVVSVTMPPLCDRQQDIPSLAGFFVSRIKTRVKKKCYQHLAGSSRMPDARYDWPGKVALPCFTEAGSACHARSLQRLYRSACVYDAAAGELDLPRPVRVIGDIAARPPSCDRLVCAENSRRPFMRFTWLNLMPWPYLPDDFRTAHRSVWVDIDSRLFDPVKAHDVYNSYMDVLDRPKILRNSCGRLPERGLRESRSSGTASKADLSLNSAIPKKWYDWRSPTFLWIRQKNSW
jgi:Sigma-54 interaction domain